MVKNAFALGRSGLQDWLLQRITAVILAVYSLFLLVFILKHQPLQFQDWHDLFAHSAVRYFSLSALISLALHAWIGVWTVITDYIKANFIRLYAQLLLLGLVVSNTLWGIKILWNLS